MQKVPEQSQGAEQAGASTQGWRMFPGCGKERKAWERSRDAWEPLKPQAAGQTGGSLVQQKFLHASASEIAASILAVLEFILCDRYDGKYKTWTFQPIFTQSVPLRWASPGRSVKRPQ